MKFLCVECDAAMKLHSTTMHEEQGSLSVVYSCPECGRQTAMLTNRGETQLVTSLGVKIGPAEDGQAAAGASEGKCPFGAMLQQEAVAAEQQHLSQTSQQPQAAAAPFQPSQAAMSGPRWTAEAQSRLQNVPEFVRPMAKMGIEQFAAQHGHPEITVEVLDLAKAQFGF